MRRERIFLGFAAVLLVVAGSGCATYTGSLREAKDAVADGQTRRGVTELNGAMKLEEKHQIPDKLTGKNTLILLERATLLQAMGKYKLAARDMMIADQQLDWLDIGAQGKAKIGKYMFSGTSVKYRAPPYERLLLNTFNMINFMAMGDFEEAKVEARRFTIIEHFFVNDDDKQILPESLAFGNYLGGVSFEAAGDYREAARYYGKAWHYGLQTDAFRRRLGDLLQMTGYKPNDILAQQSDELSKLDLEVDKGEPLSHAEYRKKYVDGQVLVIVQTGMVPYKEGKRYPIGRALTYASAHHHHYALTAEERRQANELAVSGALKWISFPVLTEQGLPPTRAVDLAIDGSEHPIHMGTNVERQVEHGWDQIAGALMAAAITRMITRAVAGAAAREGVKAATQKSGLGVLAQVAVEGGMAAADTPDTRSWSMLPARVRFTRKKLGPGRHQVEVQIDGKTDEKSVEVSESGPTIINFSRIR